MLDRLDGCVFGILALGLVAGCGRPQQPAAPLQSATPARASTPATSRAPVPAASAVAPITTERAGDAKRADETYVVHVVDVGTGLGVFVEGPGFALVYDAGSNDDDSVGAKNRFVAYLRAAKPGLKDIDHVILSHPHTDHVALLPDVLTAYNVKNVWDSGAETGICGYAKLLMNTRDKGASYHSAAQGPGSHEVKFDKKCKGLDAAVTLNHGDQIQTGLRVDLGSNAAMTFLYAEGKTKSDPNDNTLVVRLDLGGKRVLLMGDAGGGERQQPTSAPSEKSVEGILLAERRAELDADVLVVGHHGSMTSSRTAFLDAVTPVFSIISSGPTKYSGTQLPDPIIVKTLGAYGSVYRTDRDDTACVTNTGKIGPDNDKPGGCDNVKVTIRGTDAPKAEYWTTAD